MNLGCEKTRVRMDDWLDGLLDEKVHGEVKDHLAFCDECRAMFKRHLDLQGDLAALGAIAERIAAAGPGAAAGRRWRGIRIAVGVAAVMALFATGYLITQENHLEDRPGVREQIAHGKRPASELTALGDLMVRSAGSDAVQIKDGPNCVAVSVETSNPKVHLVWIYGECVSEAVGDSTDDGVDPTSNETRRL